VAVLRVHPVQQQYVDAMQLIYLAQCFVGIMGKHTARIGRSDRLLSDNVVKSNLFAD